MFICFVYAFLIIVICANRVNASIYFLIEIRHCIYFSDIKMFLQEAVLLYPFTEKSFNILI